MVFISVVAVFCEINIKKWYFLPIYQMITAGKKKEKISTSATFLFKNWFFLGFLICLNEQNANLVEEKKVVKNDEKKGDKTTKRNGWLNSFYFYFYNYFSYKISLFTFHRYC